MSQGSGRAAAPDRKSCDIRSWLQLVPKPALFHNDQLRLISLTFIMRSLPGAALLFNAFLLICLRNFKFLLLIYFFGGVALPPRFLQWSVNFLKSQQMVRKRQTRIFKESSQTAKSQKGVFCFVFAFNKRYMKLLVLKGF